MNLSDYWNALKDLAQDPLYFGLFTGTLALAIALFLLIFFAARRKPKAIRAFSDSSGEVLISLQALSELVRSSCDQLDGVTRPKIRLKVRKGTTSLRLHLRLESGSRIREIREALKTHLKMTLQDNLGFEKLGDITIVVDEYKPGPLDPFPTAPRALEPALEPPTSFSPAEKNEPPVPTLSDTPEADPSPDEPPKERDKPD